MNIRFLGDNDVYLYSASGSIDQCFAQVAAGQKIGGFNKNILFGFLDQLKVFALNGLMLNTGYISYDLETIKIHLSGISNLIVKEFIVDLHVFQENLFERFCNYSLDTEHGFTPVERVTTYVGRANVGDLIVDDQDLAVVAPVIFGKCIPAHLYFF